MHDERLCPRSSASHGGWLCCLLPLALVTSYVHKQRATPACGSPDGVHLLLIAASICMWLRTLGNLPNVGWGLKTAVGLLTAINFLLLPQTPWTTALAGALVTNFVYQTVFERLLRDLPNTFSYGEAAIMVQGLCLFVLNAICRLDLAAKPATNFAQLNTIMQSAFICLLCVCVLLALVPFLRAPLHFYLLMALLVMAVTCAPVTKPIPVAALIEFMFKEQKRLYIVGFYMLLVALTCATVRWQLQNTTQASTSVRKIFHLLIVLVYVPGIIFECALLYLGTGIALSLFVVLELLRLLRMPPFAATLRQAFDSFKDSKDAGQLALTPFCLLIGCSLPIWLSCCPCEAAANTGRPLLLLLSGILAVGVGDTAASVVGSKYGRRKWKGDRTIEGTAAFFVSVVLSIWLLQLSGLLAMSPAKWLAAVLATLCTAVVEAHTDQVDNLVLPLVFYIIVGLVEACF